MGQRALEHLLKVFEVCITPGGRLQAVQPEVGVAAWQNAIAFLAKSSK